MRAPVDGIRLRGFVSMSVRLVALIGYCMMTFGVPMPTRKGSVNDVPFPCQDNACGCQTARQCWTNCRCYTPAERVRWAVRRGVAIPDYAVLPPADELATILAEDPSASTCSKSENCCCSKMPQETRSAPSTAEIRIAVGSLVARCCGLSLDAVASMDVSLPPLSVVPTPLQSTEKVSAAIELHPSRRNDRPPSPPP